MIELIDHRWEPRTRYLEGSTTPIIVGDDVRGRLADPIPPAPLLGRGVDRALRVGGHETGERLRGTGKPRPPKDSQFEVFISGRKPPFSSAYQEPSSQPSSSGMRLRRSGSARCQLGPGELDRGTERERRPRWAQPQPGLQALQRHAIAAQGPQRRAGAGRDRAPRCRRWSRPPRGPGPPAVPRTAASSVLLDEPFVQLPVDDCGDSSTLCHVGTSSSGLGQAPGCREHRRGSFVRVCECRLDLRR